MPIPLKDQELPKSGEQTPNALSDQVVDRLRLWIKQGHLQEGDVLPSERELAKIFNVSRMPIRGALNTLKFLGVVQQVRGEGLVIKKIDVSEVINNIDFLLVNSLESLHELFEVRKVLEGHAALLAATRRTQEDLESIEDTLLEMERGIQLNRNVDISSSHFHTAIAKASHNNILIKINNFLAELLHYSFAESLKDTSRHEISLKRHKEIFQRIKEGDADGANAIMQRHLDESDEALAGSAS
ncbi:MAG: FadR family transcriptional regulator [Desulfovibrionaceae bacterium]|jgi:GntR family transcriptional repressor for pyruvate dehydrogenase complex|nr:FadR family transcriptional regulator [Desulfovibrionaceae bacterium]